MHSSRWAGPLKALVPLTAGILLADRVLFIGAAGAPRSSSVVFFTALGLIGGAAFALARGLAPGRRLFPVLVMSGFLLWGVPRSIPPPGEVRRAIGQDRPLLVAARVVSVEPRRDGGCRVRMDVQASAEGVRWRSCGARFLMTWPMAIENPRAGDFIVARVRLEAIRGATNPGGYDSRRPEWRRGTDARARLRRPEDLILRREAGFLSVDRALRGLRSRMGEVLDRTLGGFPGRFSRVLLLGDRVAFRAEEEADFRQAGVTHILSVSGLHVGLVAATVQLVAGRRRRPGSLVASTLAIWGYTLLVGAPSAAVRSAVMLTLGLAARHFRRRMDGVTLLSGAVFLLLVPAPALLFDLGFRLSVASIAGLMLAHSLLEGWPALAGWPKPLRTAVSVTALTLGAQAATAPMTVPLWGDWPLVAPLSNLLVVGLSDLILTGGLLALSLHLIDPASGDRVLAAVWALSKLLGWAVHQLATRSPGVRGLLPAPPWLPVTCLIGLVALGTSRAVGVGRRGQAAIAVLLAASFAGLVAWPESRPAGLRVTSFDVGQGDATLVEFPDGRTLLVDGGEGGAGDSGGRVVLPGLRAAGHRRLDAVVVSHAHHDHMGGLFAVVAAGQVRQLYDSGYGPADGEMAAFRRAALAVGTPICLVTAGDTLMAGPGYSVTVVWPPGPVDPADERNRPANTLNDESIVLDIRWRTRRIILPGDLERPGERPLLAAIATGPVDFLKAGHHGSRTSSGEDWIDHLSPRHVAVSVGERNRFGHPSPMVMERYRNRGIELHRTDEAGAWRLTWSEGGDPVHESWGDGRSAGASRHRNCSRRSFP